MECICLMVECHDKETIIQKSETSIIWVEIKNSKIQGIQSFTRPVILKIICKFTAEVLSEFNNEQAPHKVI
jgi:hypothetical protein